MQYNDISKIEQKYMITFIYYIYMLIAKKKQNMAQIRS